MNEDPISQNTVTPPPADPAAYHVDNDPAISRRNARNGLILFVIYVALYVGFMYMSAFEREAMQKPSFLGINLAVVYGMGLILAAFVLALVYMLLSRGRGETEMTRDS